MSRQGIGGVPREAPVWAPGCAGWRGFPAGACVLVLTLLCFLPSLKGSFLNWDDEPYLVDEYRYRGLSAARLRWMSTTTLGGPYQPLTWLSFSLDHLLWGMDPWGFHLTNVLLHALNALLFYLFCLRLLSLASPPAPRCAGPPDLRWPAAFAALLFSLHPLRVESVAWAIERKDVLSGAFFLAALNAYLTLHGGPIESESPRPLLKAAVPALYACSLLSKGTAVTFPGLLLLLDIHPLRRLSPDPRRWLRPGERRLILEKTPFLLLAAAGAAVNLLGQSRHASMPSLTQHGIADRLLGALYSLAFYAGKTLYPAGLSPVYPRPESPFWTQPRLLAPALAALAAAALALRVRRRAPWLLAAFAAYALLLAPVSGLVPFGGSIAADRYSYLSCLPWATVAGGLLLRALSRLAPGARALCSACALGALLALGGLTRRQIRVWRDSESLWRHALSLDPAAAGAHINLADAIEKRGRLEEAEAHYRSAISLSPKRALARVDLAELLERRGAKEEALEQCARALEAEPADPSVHLCLGRLLEGAGRHAEAETHLKQAFSQGSRLRMPAPAERSTLESALRRRREELKAMPLSASAHNNLGNALAVLGDLEGAIERYRESLRLEEKAAAHFNLANTLALLGRPEEAAAHYERALLLDPSFEAARVNLGKVQWAAGGEGRGGWGSRKR